MYIDIGEGAGSRFNIGLKSKCSDSLRFNFGWIQAENQEETLLDPLPIPPTKLSPPHKIIHHVEQIFSY